LRADDTARVVLVVVDAENVRRSLWPNLSREELVRRAREWAAGEGHELLVVFDGRPPEDAPDLIGSHDADDAIVELTEVIDQPWWLVTSDRELRQRVGEGPERIMGGGSFARAI
jgi:polyphosphate kinase 2 (PPK2 family)